MTNLEGDLRVTLAAHSATPSRDVLGAATRRHRRRRTLQGGAASTGALGLAAVLAFNLVGGSGSATPTPVVRLDAQTVAMRVADTLAANGDAIQYVEFHNRVGAEVPALLRSWSDSIGDTRYLGSKSSKASTLDQSSRLVDGRWVLTTVFHGDKTWSRSTSPSTRVKSELPCPTGQEHVGANDDCRYTAEAIRAASTGEPPAYSLVGEERIDGRETIRLRATDPNREYLDTVYDDLWVDAQTYEIVRREWLTNTEDGSLHQKARFDYEFLPRTEANLDLLDAVVPDGFKQVPQSRG